MILCVCKNISEKRYKELKEQGLSTKEAIKQLGLGTQCGTCVKFVRNWRYLTGANKDEK